MAAKKNKFDDKLSRLRALEDAPEGQAVHELRLFLAEKDAFFLGEAAKMVKTLELRQLEQDLVQACRKLLSKEIPDRGCIAKRCILDALVTFETHVPDLYLVGLRHVQMEYSVGPPEDTAGSVRGLCIHALVRIDFPDAILEIAPMLFDDLPEVRIAAAEALAVTGDRTCAGILHVRLLAGEDKPDVLEALYRTMLSFDTKRYLSVVAEALEKGEEAAALALGESRLSTAFPVLRDALRTATGDLEATVLLSIGLLRIEEATEYLLKLVEEGSEHRAVKVIEALGLHRHDERLAKRVADIVKNRKSKRLSLVLAEKFGRNV